MKKQSLYPAFYNIKLCLRVGIPVGWTISGFFSIIPGFLAVDDSILGVDYFKYCGFFHVGIILMSFFSSFFVPKLIRRIVVAMVIIGFIFVGCLMALGIVIAVYFMAKPNYLHMLLFVSSVSVAWLVQVYLHAVERVKRNNLIKKHYNECENCFVLSRPIMEFNGAAVFTTAGHIRYNWICGFLVLFFMYEFFITDFAEALPVDLFKYWLLASLTSVLLAYLLARYVQGFYLWVYLPWRLERKTGKRFLFPDPKDGAVLELI